MKYINALLLIFILGISIGSISSCSSGGSSNPEMVVTPSLGQVNNATLAMFNLDGTPIAITATVQADGTFVVSYPSSVTGPVYLELTGNSDATYFDEASGTFLPFTDAQSFRVYLISPQTIVGVTALTELAAALLDTVSPVTAELITQANESIRAALAPSLDSITQPPQMIGSNTDLSTFAANDAGEYAAILASLAELAVNSASESPLLELISQLVADVQSGNIDGMDKDGNPINTLYNPATFINDFMMKLNEVAMGTPVAGTDFGNASADVGGFDGGQPGDVPGDVPGDGNADLSGTISNPENAVSGQWELLINDSIANDGQLNSGAVMYNFNPVNNGANYEVRVDSAFCNVSNATGTISNSVDISNINITCNAPPPDANLSGTISNPSAVIGQWELRVNGIFANDGLLSDGAVNYNVTPVNNGSLYLITVDSFDCNVSNGTGNIMDGIDVININITCIPS